jgi:hypothetical protein
MADDPTGLLKLAAALLRDRQLRMRFNHEPDQVIAEFQLTPAHRSLLYSMKAKEIGDAIETVAPTFAQEVRGKTPDPREFPPCDDQFLEDLDIGRTEYPSPEPQIQFIRPKRVKLQDLDGLPGDKKFALTISGQSFARDPDPSVRVRHIPSQTDLMVQSYLAGTFRCSRLVAIIANPTPTGLSPGIYKVIVTNNGSDITRGNPNTPKFAFDFEIQP